MLFEHTGDNRSGKTLGMALWGFFDWLRGQRVYANCRMDKRFPGGFDCFINYPHWHYTPEQLYYMPEIYKCTVLTDEAGEYMDSRKSNANEVLELGYFGKQATKAGVDWHWDTVDHTEIEKRIRKKWHFQINTVRIPRDPTRPLFAIRLEWRHRYTSEWRRGYFPGINMINHGITIDKFYPIYNDTATIRRRQMEDYA